MFDRKHKERITFGDTPASSIMKMSEGNPGALNVLTRVLVEGSRIDPDAGHGQSFFILLNFDSIGLYGPNVWVLYKNLCEERLDKTIAVLRACQLGYVSDAQIHAACANRGAVLDVNALCRRVKERLPNFMFTEGDIE